MQNLFTINVFDTQYNISQVQHITS